MEGGITTEYKGGIYIHYTIADIHNSLEKFDKMIDQIAPSRQDEVILLGDAFDRGGENPDPVGVYFSILRLSMHVNVKWVQGNHDHMLAEYIYSYYGMVEKKRYNIAPYRYNSFDLMKNRLTQVDMLNLADLIMNLPLQTEINIGRERYLLAHAMTIDPSHGEQDDKLYLDGLQNMEEYWHQGVEGYISLVGHTDSGYMYNNPHGRYLDGNHSIWVNDLGNVYMLDCGCGLSNGRLACICLETGERFYA